MQEVFFFHALFYSQCALISILSEPALEYKLEDVFKFQMHSISLQLEKLEKKLSPLKFTNQLTLGLL